MTGTGSADWIFVFWTKVIRFSLPPETESCHLPKSLSSSVKILLYVFPEQMSGATESVSELSGGLPFGLAFLLICLIGPSGVWHAFWITEVLSAIVAYPVYRKAVGKC